MLWLTELINPSYQSKVKRSWHSLDPVEGQPLPERRYPQMTALLNAHASLDHHGDPFIQHCPAVTKPLGAKAKGLQSTSSSSSSSLDQNRFQLLHRHLPLFAHSHTSLRRPSPLLRCLLYSLLLTHFFRSAVHLHFLLQVRSCGVIVQPSGIQHIPAPHYSCAVSKPMRYTVCVLHVHTTPACTHRRLCANDLSMLTTFQ